MYRSLTDAVRRHGGQFVPHLTKYMDAVSITDWTDLTRAKIEDLKDMMLDDVAKSSAKTYLSVLKSIINRYREEPEITVPCECINELMKLRADDTVKTYLNKSELEKFEAVPVNSDILRLTKHIFLVGAYTGMRTSDIRNVRLENIQGNQITYVSQKTGVSSTIPLREKIVEYIRDIQENDSIVRMMTRQTMNRDVKSICKRAGINDGITTHRGGKTRIGQKWKYVTMHTARISFCSNLAKLHVSIYDIAKMAGHKDIKMTERYIVVDNVQLNDRQMKYFQ